MAQGINKFIGIGNLGRDPEFKVTPNDVQICTFSVGIGTKRGQSEHTYWANCKAFNRLAEICNQYLKKGSKIYIEGRLDFQQWEHEGKKYSKTEVLIDQMQMLGGKEVTQSQGNSSERGKPAQQEEFEDDIPF